MRVSVLINCRSVAMSASASASVSVNVCAERVTVCMQRGRCRCLCASSSVSLSMCVRRYNLTHNSVGAKHVFEVVERRIIDAQFCHWKSTNRKKKGKAKLEKKSEVSASKDVQPFHPSKSIAQRIKIKRGRSKRRREGGERASIREGSGEGLIRFCFIKKGGAGRSERIGEGWIRKSEAFFLLDGANQVCE